MRYIFYIFVIGTLLFFAMALGFGFLLAHYLQDTQPLDVPIKNNPEVASGGSHKAAYLTMSVTPLPNVVNTAAQALTNKRATQEAIAADATQTSIAIGLAQKHAEAQATRVYLSNAQTISAAAAEATTVYIKSAPQRAEIATEHQHQMGLLSFIGGLGSLILAAGVLLRVLKLFKESSAK